MIKAKTVKNIMTSSAERQQTMEEFRAHRDKVDQKLRREFSVATEAARKAVRNADSSFWDVYAHLCRVVALDRVRCDNAKVSRAGWDEILGREEIINATHGWERMFLDSDRGGLT